VYPSKDSEKIKSVNDPIGPENDEWLLKLAQEAALVVAAWGNLGEFKDRGKAVMALIPNLHYLKLNETSQPANPLRLPSDLKPKPINAQPSEETNTPQSTVVRTSRGLTIAGTRITLYQIMDYVKAGHPRTMIRDHFRLTIKQTDDILKYIEDHQEAVEMEYQQVLADAKEIRHYWEERNRDRLEKIKSASSRPDKEHLRTKLQADKARLGMV
jgi:uncharacterized protein (DUF433 family)